MLTRKEALKKSYDMWEWIANRTYELERFVYKKEYFNNVKPNENIMNGCYLCEYVTQNFECGVGEDYITPNCLHCPVKWDKSKLFNESYECVNSSPYLDWMMCEGVNWQDAYARAKEISYKISKALDEEEALEKWGVL